MRGRPARWLPWLLVAVSVAWLFAYPCNLWSLVPAAVIALTAGSTLAPKIWKARGDVFAAPAMIVAVYGVCGLGAAGLWIVVIAFRCLGHGSID